jgi:hypothetical protein
MSFQTAIDKTPLLKDHLKNGLQALGSNSSKVKPPDTRKCEGSVNIDDAIERQFPSSNRWDYAVGYNGRTYFIEVHPADTSEVKTVLEKLTWLKSFMVKNAPELNKEPKSFHWISSGGVHILPNSPQAKRLALSGIRSPVKQLTLL